MSYLQPPAQGLSHLRSGSLMLPKAVFMSGALNPGLLHDSIPLIFSWLIPTLIES